LSTAVIHGNTIHMINHKLIALQILNSRHEHLVHPWTTLWVKPLVRTKWMTVLEHSDLSSQQRTVPFKHPEMPKWQWKNTILRHNTNAHTLSHATWSHYWVTTASAVHPELCAQTRARGNAQEAIIQLVSLSRTKMLHEYDTGFCIIHERVSIGKEAIINREHPYLRTKEYAHWFQHETS
jgi:hypothetical protein